MFKSNRVKSIIIGALLMLAGALTQNPSLLTAGATQVATSAAQSETVAQ